MTYKIRAWSGEKQRLDTVSHTEEDKMISVRVLKRWISRGWITRFEVEDLSVNVLSFKRGR